MTPGTDTTRTLPLLAPDSAASPSSGCGCGGCGCDTATTETPTADATPKENDMTSSTPAEGYSQNYAVTGMTCGHCVASVMEEIGEIDGVREVNVDLVAGGSSSVTVTSDEPLGEDVVRAAVEEAGYQLA